MKKLFIPFVSLLVMANVAGAQTKSAATKQTTAKTTEKAPAPAGASKKVTVKKHVVKKHVKSAMKKVAEREETITLDNSDDRTIVEIQAGGVYVNGDLVSTIADAKKENHKIIISNKEQKPKVSALTRENYPEAEIDEAPNHRAMLGVFTSDNGENEGARVRSVVSGSPADAAGFQNGDLIIKVGGMDIKNSADLVAAVNDHNWGEMVSITYMRNGHQEFTRADLGEVTLRRIPESDDYGQVPDSKGQMTLPDPFMYSYEKKYYDKLYDNDY